MSDALSLQHEIDRGQTNELLEVIHEQALRIAAVVRRLRRLKNPESVDFVGGSRMIDLWTEHVTG